MRNNLDIKKLARLFEDKDKINELGSELTRMAIKNAAEDKMGLKMEDPMVERKVKAGEYVPEDLRDVVRTDSSGKAASGWTESWTDLWVWNRTYSDTASISRYGNFLPRRLGRVISDIQLEPDELEILNRLDIRPGERD